MDEVDQLKQGHRAMWSAGDYETIALPLRSAGALIVARTAIGPGHDVLDVACGTGNATIAAAEAGGRVTGADLTPALMDQAAARAAELGVTSSSWRPTPRRCRFRTRPSTCAVDDHDGARAPRAAGPVWQALRDDLTEMFSRNNAASNGTVHIPAEYLIAHGRKQA